MDDLYKQIASLPPEKRELFELMLQEQGVDLNKIAIVPQPRNINRFPLSYSQQRLWFLDQLEPGSALYNIAPVIRIRGNLNVTALERSFRELIRRHEVLRTTFDKDGDQPVQVIRESFDFRIDLINLQNSSPTVIDSEINDRALEEASRPFNLQEGPLLRVNLLQFTEIDHVLLMTMHHIVSDNWSTGLLVHEVVRLYEAFSLNLPSPLQEMAVQYADFSVWQRKWLRGKTLENQIEFWRRHLEGAPPVLEMPLDYSRPSYQTYNGDYLTFQISKTDSMKLEQLCRKYDVTLFMALLSAFYVLLYRYSNQDDICVGTPIANRNRRETEALIGFFVNTLVLRLDISGNPSFDSLLKKVKDITLGAYAHQDLPFETLVEELHPERDMSHSPFFQSMFVLNNAPVGKLAMSDLELSLIEIENKTSKYDLIFNAIETESGLRFKVEYNTDLYQTGTIKRMIAHYSAIVENVILNPECLISDIRLITGEESKLLKKWSMPAAVYDSGRTVLDFFRDSVRIHPDNLAIRVKNESLSYRELDELSDRLGNHLRASGMAAGSICGICAERSVYFVAGLLAILKSGGVYLPLDPGYPSERLNYMLSDSRAAFLLTDENLMQQFAGQNLKTTVLNSELFHTLPPADPHLFPAIEGGQTAYIIYTSGSTGQPKGVEISNLSIANHCLDMKDYYQLVPGDNVLQFAALNFDASIEQILPPLMSGATVVMRDDELWEINRFHEKILEYDLSVINLPTAYWAQLAREWAKNPELTAGHRLRLIIIGGDVLSPDALALWQKTDMNHIRLLNAYGPTETTITASTFEISHDFSNEARNRRVPIGRPRANREVFVVDAHTKQVPPGIAGELLIGGAALAKGYLHRPELTAEKFIQLPHLTHNRLYRTGDLVRFLPDGNIDFLGRVDQQVKIRGFRIELGEIEAILREHPAISDVIVSARREKTGEKQLVAHMVLKHESEMDRGELRNFLKSRLPDYMIPAVFMQLPALPLDPSGKINRRALPEPSVDDLKTGTEYIAPRTSTEQKLAEIVCEVVNISKVGVHDNFFEIGGHSMMATQVVSRIRDAFGVDVSLRALFENPTIEGIATAITEMEVKEQNSDDLGQLLDELEGLSEEEVQRLLNEN